MTLRRTSAKSVDSSRTRRRFGVRPRLILAVGLPVAFLLIAMGQLSSAALGESRRASAVEDSLSRAEALLEVNAAIFNERLAVEASGLVTDDEPSMALQGLSAERAATDSALERLEPPVLAWSQEISRMRETQNRGRTLATFPGRYGGIVQDVRDEIDAEFDRALANSGLIDTPELQSRVAVAKASFAASAASFEVTVHIQSFWQSADFEKPLIRSLLSRWVQLYETEADDIDDLATGASAVLWSETAQLRSTIDDLVDDLAIGVIPPADQPLPDEIRLASLPAAMTDLSLVASAEATTDARQVARDARNAAALQAALAAVFVLVAIAAVVVLARSIVRPARRLAESADAVASGAIQGTRIAPSGARELHVAAVAFNDLVKNLELAERKVASLGAADLDAAAMSEPLPGRMGEALEQSLDTLSSALREQDRLRSRLEFDASHDPLTGVFNREAMLRSFDDHSGSTVVASLELRSFKSVNDTYGDSVGDEVLRLAARRLVACGGEDATVARIGGDEFAIVKTGLDRDAAVLLGERSLSSVTGPYDVNGLTISINADLGLAYGSEDGRTLLGQALLAGTEARRGSDRSVRVFDDDMRAALDRRAKVERLLIDALSTQAVHDTDARLRLEYQPIIDTTDVSVPLVEALLRFDTGDETSVSPAELIEVAERSALILQLGAWVLREATSQLAAWRSHPHLRQLGVSINASAIQLLDPSFATDVTDAVIAAGLASERVTIEVTETALIADTSRATATLDRLRRFGVRIAIDDFGSGFTGIAQLRSLPADKLKIDRSLITNVAESGRDRALVGVIIEVGRQLGLDLVAEGVEEANQCTALELLGVNRMQGWLFSKSLRPDAIPEWIATFARDAADSDTSPPEAGESPSIEYLERNRRRH